MTIALNPVTLNFDLCVNTQRKRTGTLTGTELVQEVAVVMVAQLIKHVSK